MDITLTLRLINPCPTATLSNLRRDPFFSVKYSLGDEPINQPYRINNLVRLNTVVDCGPVKLTFIDQNGLPLNPNAFSVEKLPDKYEVISVIQQENTATLGTYKIRYRAWLPDYPSVETYLEDPFTVDIVEPAYESQYIMNTAPQWLLDLKD